MTEPQVLPPDSRQGYCEGCTHRKVHGTGTFGFQRKPMFLLDGRRLCRECCRKAQRADG